jgi:hypothetical protein
MGLCLLFQPGAFEFRVRSILATSAPSFAGLPVSESMAGLLDAQVLHISWLSASLAERSTVLVLAIWQILISETITTGGSLYDKGYQDLCLLLYVSYLILSDSLFVAEANTTPTRTIGIVGRGHVCIDVKVRSNSTPDHRC